MLILRKFRRKLMKKNKLTSYIVYAFGEILLVVIGILIAVLLNNKNNESKLQRMEELSLIRLSEDLRDDIKRYEFLNLRLGDRLNKCDSTLNLISAQNSREQRLNIISIHQINYFLVEANTTTYDEMLNTGRLYSMNDKQLRARIIKYYRQVNKWSTYIEKNNLELRNMSVQSNYNDYWVIQEKIWAEQKIQDEQYPWLAKKHSRELNDLEALIRKAEDVFGSSQSQIRYLKDEAKKLIQVLDEESSLAAEVFNN